MTTQALQYSRVSSLNLFFDPSRQTLNAVSWTVNDITVLVDISQFHITREAFNRRAHFFIDGDHSINFVIPGWHRE